MTGQCWGRFCTAYHGLCHGQVYSCICLRLMFPPCWRLLSWWQDTNICKLLPSVVHEAYSTAIHEVRLHSQFHLPSSSIVNLSSYVLDTDSGRPKLLVEELCHDLKCYQEYSKRFIDSSHFNYFLVYARVKALCSERRTIQLASDAISRRLSV